MTRSSLAAAIVALSAAVLPVASPGESAAKQPRHVVLMVWDGMRPDFVTDKYAPTLNQLARDGVRFRNHHSVYCTSTNVNGSAIATGVYPNRNGIFANLEFRPAINAQRLVDTGERDTLTTGDAAMGSKYLAAPTIAELVRQSGKRVALAGSKSVAQLFDRHNDWSSAVTREHALTVFAGAPVADPLRDSITALLGPFLVESGVTSAQRNGYVTRALTEVLWRDGVPDFSLLWSSEPDLTQHNRAVGSPEALAAIKAADDNLAAVLRALEQKHARDSTDVLVVSDHGFSTIRRSIDVVQLLNDNGFHAVKEWTAASKAGDVLLAGNGGSVSFYVREHERSTTQRLVEWLQRSDFAGVIFTHENLAGTFPLSAIHIDTTDAADVVMSFRWSGEKNQFDLAGMIDADWNRKAGQGTHATLSAFDVHNTFIAAGPDFPRAYESDLPSGNIDIAPTILHLLGIPNGSVHFDGRVVTEALSSPGRLPVAAEHRLDASHQQWKQWLKTTRVGQTIYFDSGNSGSIED